MRIWSVLALLACCSQALATSYAPPKRRDVYCSNRAFVLDVNPETNVHTVYAADHRTKPLWSFSRPVWHYPFLLSDDGSVVATVAWEHIREEDIANENGVEFR